VKLRLKGIDTNEQLGKNRRLVNPMEELKHFVPKLTITAENTNEIN